MWEVRSWSNGGIVAATTAGDSMAAVVGATKHWQMCPISELSRPDRTLDVDPGIAVGAPNLWWKCHVLLQSTTLMSILNCVPSGNAITFNA